MGQFYKYQMTLPLILIAKREWEINLIHLINIVTFHDNLKTLLKFCYLKLNSNL